MPPFKPAAGAGLTGSKMARRVGSVDEFEFKAIGENHNQGVSFCSFYFIFFGSISFFLEEHLQSVLLIFFFKKPFSLFQFEDYLYVLFYFIL
jgi:hypothetical protein